MHKLTRIILIIVGGAALGVGGCVWMIKRTMDEALDTRTDVALYSGIAEEHRKWGEGYQFLPKVVPFDAEESSFFHTPGFLQGGDDLALRLRLPKERITKLLRELEQSGRTEVIKFEPLPEPRCYPKWNLTHADMKKHPYESIVELPPDFRIFLFRSDLKDIEKNWNHNFMALTAISVERREVVYYVENW